jgi:hypothetical protein
MGDTGVCDRFWGKISNDMKQSELLTGGFGLQRATKERNDIL